MAEEKFGIPIANLSYHVWLAVMAMPYDESERVFRKLQFGFGLEGSNEDGVVHTIQFRDGTPFIRMLETDLLVPPPVVEYC